MISLNITSCYTLLESTISPEKLIDKAKALNASVLGIADHNILAAAASLNTLCKRNGIKPVYGMKIDLDDGGRSYPLFLYAANIEGYKGLIRLSSKINTEDLKVDLVNIKPYLSDNLPVLISTMIPGVENSFDVEQIKQALTKIRQNIGEFHIGIDKQEFEYYRKANDLIRQASRALGIKTMVFNTVNYLEKGNYQALEVLRAIKNKTVIKNIDSVFDEQTYFKTEEELRRYYPEEDFKNLKDFSDGCDVDLSEIRTYLPSYPLKQGVSSAEYLKALCVKGLSLRLKGKVQKEYSQRLKYELDVILSMHFEDYFLIVYDFILYAKKNDIYVGPGRGSAAGSLVAYCLGITDIDPLKYGLYFERFLNPERISMPDIDTDFPDDRRDEVIAYVANKYGNDHVAHIVTYGTLKAKQVVRDVGRVLGLSDTLDIDRLAKAIPNTLNITLEAVYNESKVFRDLINAYPQYQTLYRLSKIIEGLPRHLSTHAAGIVFSKDALSDVMPLYKIEQDLYSTQFQMEHLEEFGLIKMDFLGLRNLSIIKEIVDEVNKTSSLDIRNIPLNDPKTFKLIDNVNTLGIFQLESSGMVNLIRKMQPKTFEDIAITIALFRPGPMANIPVYLNQRKDPDQIVYKVPALKPILRETSGVIVYQEQIMEIARTMASFSLAKADTLRKAMSKKQKKLLDSLKKEFIDGCLANGYKLSDSQEIYSLIERFADYGFNKSHSVAYANIAYQMAYLKANYPLYFYKAIFNGSIGSDSKTYEITLECNKMGIEVVKPDINLSEDHYIIHQDCLLAPLSIVSNIGSVILGNILKERNTKGPYRSYIEAICRLNNIGVNQRALEYLIWSGALDGFDYNRTTMVNNLDIVLKYASFAYSDNISLLESEADLPLIKRYQDDKKNIARKEKEVYGFYFTIHPIDDFKKAHNIEAVTLNELNGRFGQSEGFGMIERIRTHRTKSNATMAFVTVSDETGDFDLVLMPKEYSSYQNQFAKGKYLLFSGNIDREGSILVKRMRVFESDE